MVILVPISVEDNEWLYKLIVDNLSRLKDYFPQTVGKVTSAGTALTTIANYQEAWKSYQYRVYVLKYNDERVGILFIKQMDSRHAKCELAYFIDKNFEGKGICTQAINYACTIAFDELYMNKVYCKVDVNNIASRRVAQKAGFVEEGILKQEFRMNDDSFADIVYLGRLKTDR